MADLVYSTGPKGPASQSGTTTKKKSGTQGSTQGKNSSGDGKTLKVRLEKKGRGGKVVTVVFAHPFAQEDLKSIMQQWQHRFACGGTLKDGHIELRGDLRAQLEKWARENQLRLQLAGG